MAVLPALMNSSGCWIDLPKAAIEKLNKLQATFYRVLLKTPKTCPTPGLLWFTGGTLILNKIIQNKLLFLFHLEHLNQNTLGKEVLQVQKKLELGLWNECMIHLRELNISIQELKKMTKTVQAKSQGSQFGEESDGSSSTNRAI